MLEEPIKKKVWFHRDWFEAWIDLNLNNLSKYGDTLEDLLNSKLKSFKFNFWIEEATKITAEEQENFREFCVYSRDQLSHIFPSILRSSLFLMSYAFLENQLVNLCKSLEKQLNYKIKFAEIQKEKEKESEIEKVKYYMKRVGKINFPDQTSAWNSIKHYSYIRNFIMHNGGKLNNSNQAKKVESFINARPSISLDRLRNIQFSKSFCSEVNKTLRSFFNDLFKALPYFG